MLATLGALVLSLAPQAVAGDDVKLGKDLVLARERGVSAIFLLTTTAEDFFPRFGFERVSRAAVPESVRASVEFQSACPASAVVMALPIEEAAAT